MAYFNRLPNIEYDKKPLTFPFSEREYVLAKNFFRRFKLSESSYNFQNFFNEYVMTDQDRIDYLSYKFYNTSEFDWVILITNNIINSYFDLAVRESDLYEIVQKAYGNPEGIHHYETFEVKNSSNQVVLKKGLKVEKSFYDGVYKYYDNGQVVSVNGNDISIPVTNFEYERNLNDEKRKIYILRPEYVQEFISQFDDGMEYARSSSYINKTTKKAGI
jgi:hypothetical protein